MKLADEMDIADQNSPLRIKYQALLQENKTLKEENKKLKNQLHIPADAAIAPKKIIPQTSSPQKEIKPNSLFNVNQQSASKEKIKLFLSLFKGRSDVYAKRWNNKSGKSGYSPVCANEWKPGICQKPKIKCAHCLHQKLEAFNEKVIEEHLRGKVIAGMYPLCTDETCHFLAIDFDGDGWQKDVSVLRNTCEEFNIPYALERSRSGNGGHAWFFFKEPIPAVLARKLGSALLTCSMNKRHEITFKSYDRLFPNQDIMPKGGFGNLIALPLQRTARTNGNSIFFNENFEPYSDQWELLSTLEKLGKRQVSMLVAKLCQGKELGQLKEDTEKSKPWKKSTRKSKVQLSRSDFPDTVRIVKADMLYIEKASSPIGKSGLPTGQAGISQRGLTTLKRFAAFKNPQFYKAQAMRMPVYNKPRIVSCADETKDYLCLPRGCEADVLSLLHSLHIKINHLDKRNPGENIEATFTGALRDEQDKAINVLLKHDDGVLSAPPAFGKTVVAAKLISEKEVNTLILVHRKQLQKQWINRLSSFLKIETDKIGQLGGGKNSLTGIIDVAIMQSLNSTKVISACMKNYGMVIIDECHHIPAFSFEQILKQTNAKYVYGLTATPSRQDGHHPIIFMYCGPIRYKVDIKRQAANRPFEHYVIPRFTSFMITSPLPKNETKALSIQDIYTKLANDEMRNQFIVDDVVKNYKKGRNSLILTERTAHVAALNEKLKNEIPDIITLTGCSSAKKATENFHKISAIPKEKQITLIATGKYIGEGFDEPRLDTLFLAMPISWKGTLQQYTGRLNRLYENKKEVQVYDYVDIHVKMLEKMYTKRLNGYAFIGYKAKGEGLTTAPVNIIFDKDNFLPVYTQDIINATKELMIVSPYVTKKRVEQMLPCLEEALSKRVKITVITRPPDDFKNKDNRILEVIFDTLKNKGIILKHQSKIHQKFAIIDQRIVWYGSINLLSFGYAQESIMRIESGHIANELKRSMGL